jgi:hypothetical protein
MFIVKICRKFLHFAAETKVLPEQVFDSVGKFISGTQNALYGIVECAIQHKRMRACNTLVSLGHESRQRLYRKVNQNWGSRG